MQHPRDFREWQRYVERGLTQAQRGTSIAIAHTDEKTATVVDEIDSYKNLTPTAPVELNYQTSTYIDVNGKRRGRVVVDFPDVVLSTDAQALTVSNYELSGQDQGSSPLDAWRTLATSDTSSLMAMDFAPGAIWKFRVRALSGNFTNAGQWSAETQVTITSDTTPPPQPSTPVVTATGGTLKVTWDGKDVGGNPMPADFDRLEVYFALTSSPTVKVTSFYEASFDVFPKSAYNVAHYFRFRAVDSSGNFSAYSTQASGTPVPLVDVDIILSAIDGAKTTITNIGNQALLDGAVTGVKLADNAITQAKLQDNIISASKLTTTVNASINQGISDAAAAQTSANTANTAAGTAQTAADAARAVVDAKVASGATLNINGNFDATPIVALPIGWTFRSNTQAQVSATTARSGTGVLKCTPSTGAPAYAYTDFLASATGRVFYVEYWVRLDQAVVAGNENLLLGAYFTGVDTSGAASPSPQYGSAAAGALYPQVKLSALSTSTWTKFALTYTVTQANNVQMRFGPRMPQLAVAGNTFEVDGFRVVDMTEAQAALDAAATAQSKADSAFSNAQTALTNAGLAQSTADGKASAYYTSSAPAGSGFSTNDLWFRSPDNAVFRWNGTTWANIQDTSIATAKSAADSAAAAASTADTKAVNAQTAANTAQTAANTAQTSANNASTAANSVVKTTTAAATGTPPTTGAIWNQTNSAGDLIINTWTSNTAGTAWVLRKLDDAVIGNLNASTINAGFINAARLQATDIRTLFLTAGKVTAADIVTGTLTSASGVFGTIDASIINAGTLNAARLLAGDVRAKFLAAGLVTAADIVTGTITAASGVIGSLDIGKVTTGTMSGSFITANTIGVKQLTVSDLVNFAPSLAESPGDWTLTGGMTIVTSGVDASGYRLNAFENTGTASAKGPFMAVTPGESLYATATSYRAGGGTNGTWLRYEWYDKDKAALTSPVYTGSPQASNLGSSTVYELVATVPATAAYARLVLPIGAAGAGSGINTGFYNIMGRRQNGTVLIADGAVTANKVVANGITAKQILVGDFANIAIGSDFDDVTAVPWTLDPRHVTTTAQKKSGTRSLQLTAGTGVVTSTFIGDLRVKEGEQYFFKYHAYIDTNFNGTAGNSKLRIGDQSGTMIGSSTFVGITRNAWTGTPLSATLTIPAGVTSLQVTLVSDNTAGNAYIDDIQIRRMSEASLIMNLGVEQLTASAANIDSAVVDKMWTNVVQSRKITTDMLIVGQGENMIPWAPSVVAPHQGWNGSTVTAIVDSDLGPCLSSVNTTVTAGTMKTFMKLSSGVTSKNSIVDAFDVRETEEYSVRVGFGAGGSYVDGTPQCRVMVQVHDKAGTLLTSTYGNTTSLSYSGAETFSTVNVPIPVGGRSILIYIQQDRQGLVMVHSPFGKRKADASLIVDGGILTRHLTVTDDMVVALLNVHKIKAVDIDTNDITSDTGFISALTTNLLTADKITATMIGATSITSKHTITGATIQTSATASRGIKLTSASLKGYNSTGYNTFNLDATSGDVTVTTLYTSPTGARVKVWDDLAGRAQTDFYTDTSGQHGSIYTETQTGNGGYVTNVMHYTASPATATSWTSRLTLFADETWALGSRTAAAQVTGDGSGYLYLRGKMKKNDAAAVPTDTFLVGTTAAQQLATGTITFVYAQPVPSGTRTVIAQADAASAAQLVTQSASGSQVTFLWSTTANSSLTAKFIAVWST
jgi:hypothetical protein